MWASFKKSSIELVTMLLLSYVFSFFFLPKGTLDS